MHSLARECTRIAAGAARKATLAHDTPGIHGPAYVRAVPYLKLAGMPVRALVCPLSTFDNIQFKQAGLLFWRAHLQCDAAAAATLVY